MAVVAFYKTSRLTGAAALATIKNVDRERRDQTQLFYEEHGYIDYIERVKEEVKDIDTVKEIVLRPGFVRFACGVYTITQLIELRKKQGRSDWYV